MARAMAGASAAGTTMPDVPSATRSALAPTAVAITGRPLAIASRMVLDTPSASEGSTKQ
jgi:hypothetical protein